MAEHSIAIRLGLEGAPRIIRELAGVGIGGGVDINVRGPAQVGRVRSRDPRVPLNVNQGLSMVG